MKYFIVTTRGQIGSTKVIYPEKYNDLLKISVLNGSFYYRDEDDNEMFKRLHTIPDSQYDKAKELAAHADIVEITEQEVFDLSERYQGGLTVDDDAQVRLIEIKTKQGLELNADELKAIDPEDKTVKGFGRKKTLKDKINKIKIIANET